MTRKGEQQVQLLDIRVGGADHHHLDELTPERVAELVPSDRRMIVVDDTGALEAHHDWYGQLSLGVREAICVAVGPLTAGPPVELRQSAAVRTPWVTLWVGDERGVRWAGGYGPSAAAERGELATLRELLMVLRSPAVFDEVIRQVGEVPYQTVSPALDVVFPGIDSAELRASHQRALLEITAEAASDTGPLRLEPPGSSAPNHVPSAGHSDVTQFPVTQFPVTQSPVGQAREMVAARLVTARGAVTGLLGVGGLLDCGDGQLPWGEVAALGHALGEHEQQADGLLSGLERRLAGGVPTSERGELGGVVLPPQDPPDNHTLAGSLRTGMGAALRAGHTLPEMAAMLWVLARLQAPWTLGPARQHLKEVQAGSLAARLRSAPDAVMSTGLLATIAVAALASCLIAATLPPWGPFLGVLLVLVWVAGVVVVLLRRPGCAVLALGELVFRGLAVAAAAVAGVLTGYLLGEQTGVASVPLGVVLAVAVILLATCGATLVWGWNQMVNQWSHGLGLDAVSKANEALATIVDDAIGDSYRSAARRARTEEAAGLLATGVADVNTIFTEWAARAGTGVPAYRQEAGVSGQFVMMFKGDLGALALQALADYLDDVASGAPLAVSPTRIGKSTSQLLAQYQAYLDAGSIHREPPVAADPQGRAWVAKALWQRCGESRRLLAGELRVPMTQLCGREDLRVLDGDWRGIRIFRFAPLMAQRILLGAESDDIVPVEVGAAGVLRLVPLKGGFVRHVVPRSPAGDQVISAPVTSAGGSSL